MPDLKLTADDLTLIDLALREDLGADFAHAAGDLTARYVFGDVSAAPRRRAKIISKHPEPVVVCGLAVAAAVFEKLRKPYRLQATLRDGDTVAPGATVLTVESDAYTLSLTERTVLNFLRRLCAIATLTRRYVACVAHTSMQILDTRKTTPGWRRLEKYAVRCGGGVNHRAGLYDAVMIKDNHSDSLGGVRQALARLPQDILQRCPVIVEARDERECERILRDGVGKVTRVLLDNMSPQTLRACVRLCRDRLPTEASGNITLETVAAVADTGVDYASVGALTHAAGSVDLSMVIA